jgi:hypothetical protein
MNVIPPPMATWMLKHLVLGKRNEALEGDLLEEFQQRRSESWYWRQVLGAILDLSNILRAGWVALSAVVFAAVWGYGDRVIVCLIHHSPWQKAFDWIPPEHPISIREAIVFYLAVPLSVYLALARNLSLRTLTAGLSAGVLAFAAFPFFVSHVATPLNYVLEFGRAKHWNVVLWLRGYDLLQGCLPLVAAIWAAALNKIKTGSLVP